MIGFHIDMNMAQYQADYLKRWLSDLAHAGYDTILWEVENNVAWETCPECASPDAFSKPVFRDLLAECRSLGLEPIPLLQTIGHAEYVLKHEKYAPLKELPDKLDQYCPQNPDVLPFLQDWMTEYLELFGPLRYFHIGADEAWWIGQCPRCKAYAAEHSLSQLYIQHVNQVTGFLQARGVKPCLWADMLLHYPEALAQMSREVVLFDWIYSVYPDSGKVHVWGQGLTRSEDLRPETLARFGPYLYPQGDEPGREPETFYTADYLSEQGFEVVTCPGASSYGDNVFSPRNWLHVANTFGSFQKGAQPTLKGALLTSWSVHLFPWELQWPAIHAPTFQQAQPEGDLQDYPAWYAQEHFGLPELTFWQAAGLLSKSCLFTHTSSLGFSKNCQPVPEGHARQVLASLSAAEREAAAKNCQARQEEYESGLGLFQDLAARAVRGQEELRLWALAARNLIDRAKASGFLLEHAEDLLAGRCLSGAAAQAAQEHLHSQRTLRAATEAVYQEMIQPTRRAEMMDYLFGAVEEALQSLLPSE